jgi:hypothetical protein
MRSRLAAMRASRCCSDAFIRCERAQLAVRHASRSTLECWSPLLGHGRPDADWKVQGRSSVATMRSGVLGATCLRVVLLLALLAMPLLIKAQTSSTPSWHPHAVRHPAVTDAGEEDGGEALDLGAENEEELEEEPLTAAEEEEADAALEAQGADVRSSTRPLGLLVACEGDTLGDCEGDTMGAPHVATLPPARVGSLCWEQEGGANIDPPATCAALRGRVDLRRRRRMPCWQTTSTRRHSRRRRRRGSGPRSRARR